MNDDFNFEKALSYLHELKNIILNNLTQEKISLLKQTKWLFEDIIEGALGITIPKQQENTNLQELLNKRNLARKEKNWAVADECRNKLSELGYKIIDNKVLFFMLYVLLYDSLFIIKENDFFNERLPTRQPVAYYNVFAQ